MYSSLPCVRDIVFSAFRVTVKGSTQKLLPRFYFVTSDKFFLILKVDHWPYSALGDTHNNSSSNNSLYNPNFVRLAG